MIINLHPYHDFVIDILQIYYDYPNENCNIFLVNNDIPVGFTKDTVFEIVKSLPLTVDNIYCLIHFNKHQFTIKPCKIINDDAIHILVNDKTSDEFVAEYYTVDYRIVFGWMKKYFN